MFFKKMNTEEGDKSESQYNGSGPCRLIQPRLQPISPGNQKEQADQCTPGTLNSVPVQWSQAQSVAGFTEGGESTVIDNIGMTSAFRVASTASNDISVSKEQTSNVTVSGPFTGLLALANANFLPQAAGIPSPTNIQRELNRIESGTQRQFEIATNSAASVQGMASTSTPQIHHEYGFPDRCYYDLNMPPPADNIHKNDSQYAPFTPNKNMRAEQQKIDTNDFPANLNRNNEDKTNKVTGTMFKTTEFEVQVDKDLPPTANLAPSQETADGIELNETPAKKSKRKKLRPKVINEGKSRKRNQATPKPTTSTDTTKPKRKYVRKKGLDKSTPAKVSAGSMDPNMVEASNRSCKKALNFDMEGQQMENLANLDAESTVQPMQGTEGMEASTPSRIANDLLNQETKNSMSLPESLTTPTKTTCPPNVLSANFPNVHKKRRTVKVQCPATPSHSSTETINIVELGATSIKIAAPKKFTSNAPNSNSAQRQVASAIATLEANRDHNQKVQSTQEILAGSQPKRRRLKAETVGNNFPSKAADYSPQQTHANDTAPTDYTRHTIDDPPRHVSCAEALAAEKLTLTRRRRTQKISTVNTSYLRTQVSHAQILINDHSRYLANISGGSQKDICIEILIKKLQNLDINKDDQCVDQPQDAVTPSNTQNALILYEREGRMVPYEGLFDPVKKRRPRPKVELDEETNRVWKLLLEDINSQGVDGTNEENVKRWEEEREVFRGRANSFIARMRLVQGDRHFSPWKGSVVDSVVGVFLTQNVSDHLSSSAFMTLAARFPRKSEEGSSTITDETSLSSNKNNITVESIETDEGSKAVNSSKSDRSITGERKAADDTASSQTSVDTSILQNAEKTEFCSKNNSEPEDATNRLDSRKSNTSTSFVELLQMQGPPLQMQGFTMPYGVYSHENTKFLPKLPNAVPNLFRDIVHDDHKHQKTIFHLYKSIPREEIVPSNIYQLLLNNPRLDIQRLCMPSEGNRLSSAFMEKNKDLNYMYKEHESIGGAAGPSAAPYMSNRLSAAFMNQNKDLNYMYKEHEAIAGATGHSAAPYMSKTSVHRATEWSGGLSDKGTAFWSESGHGNGFKDSADFPSSKPKDTVQQHENFSYSSCNMGDVTEIGSTFGDPSTNEPKTAAGDANLHASTVTTGGTKKSRSKQDDNKKKDAFDWDSLRREVESNGKKERTDNTMDSLDWEAVRCAKVHEIAETIRERGMNHILAERIKAFLNRLVVDHGSIDLEWLRDIQPDKAKEFLLSIRGLGLKSVECVRLLTLHHLAFPVDTNVGRIAVRLGWVPLQPLPETLQIHLLELYPVLESIQKYLWPRLCKLDQKTLYELHYQLITFGKVFCTKSRPNCNACPMRGECRHFASAFASARLALPGPEEKSIVNIAENGASHQNPAGTNHMPLPLPPASEQSREIWQLEEIYGPSNTEPIIEMPGTPEHELEGGQALEADIEDATWDNSKGIPCVHLDMEEFKQNLQTFVREQQGGEISKALVALTPEAASIPMAQLKYVNRLRTEHQVYELPDSHPLLSNMDKREPDDPCLYLLAIWRPGETANSIEPPEKTCNSQGPDNLCEDLKCFSCNGIREANSQTVRGTLLVPCRTAMRGSFPLNGTYFQVNEVFADHESSYNPIIVPRDWLWDLPRRTVYFGTSVSSIFKGLDCGKIQHCFWRGYVCVRGFEQKTRAPRPLAKRFHCTPSRQKNEREKDKEELNDERQPPQTNPKH